MNDLGQKIKHLRTMRKLTQHDVAEKMGVARNTVSQWETGERKMSAEQLIKFAQIVHVTMDYFDEVPFDENLFNLLGKLSAFFSDNEISASDKDKTYQDIMRLYLKSKEYEYAPEQKGVVKIDNKTKPY